MPAAAPRPLFSVLIPTRERPNTLGFTLRSVLEQDEARPLEVVVMDNCSAPETRALVEALRDPRLKYVRAASRLSMQDNWELGLSHTTGEYVFVLGDDDGMMPDALGIAARIIGARNPAVLAWRRYSYGWPDSVDDQMRDRLALHVGRELEPRNGREQLEALGRLALTHEVLPTIYNSFVRRDLIERVRAVHGRYFLGSAPDIYSGVVNAYFCGEYLLLRRGLSLIGSSGHSIGASGLNSDRRPESMDAFVRENGADPVHADLQVGSQEAEQRMLDLPAFMYADMLLKARARMFPGDSSIGLDFKRLVEVLAEAVARYPNSFAARKEYVERLAARHGLDAKFPRPRVAPQKKLQGVVGVDGKANSLIINCVQAGIRDVHAAARLARACLPPVESV